MRSEFHTGQFPYPFRIPPLIPNKCSEFRRIRCVGIPDQGPCFDVPLANSTTMTLVHRFRRSRPLEAMHEYTWRSGRTTWTSLRRVPSSCSGPGGALPGQKSNHNKHGVASPHQHQQCCIAPRVVACACKTALTMAQIYGAFQCFAA